MSKDYPPPRTSLRQHVAAAAARIMAEEGVDDYAQAKRKAAKRLGATDSQILGDLKTIQHNLKLSLTSDKLPPQPSWPSREDFLFQMGEKLLI